MINLPWSYLATLPDHVCRESQTKGKEINISYVSYSSALDAREDGEKHISEMTYIPNTLRIWMWCRPNFSDRS